LTIPHRLPNESVEDYLKRAKHELPKFMDAAPVPDSLNKAINNLVHQVALNTVEEIIRLHDKKAATGEDKMYNLLAKISGPTIQMMEYQTNFFMSLVQVLAAIIDCAMETNQQAVIDAMKMYRDDGLSKGSGWSPDKSSSVSP
jgi:hypothetical protein